ncbi:MAG: zf-HC2 domain-containing protein [Gemmatimonadota bacterium]
MTARFTCEQTLELLMDFVKRELPAHIAEAVQHHVDICRPCEHQARYEINFVVLLETRFGRQACPEKVKERVLEALRQEELSG